MNFVIEYIGLREGYQIEKTNEVVDGEYIFENFKEAKKRAIVLAKNDVALVKIALANTKALE